MKRTLSGVGLLCLVVLLTGCATRKPEVMRIPVTTTVIEKITTPAALLEPCPEPDLDYLETTGDIESVAIKALASLTACNEDKEKIRAWQEDNT